MTRGQLEQRSQALAFRMMQFGIKPGHIVAVLIPKSQWVPVVLLAILKLGAAFLLLDSNLPLDRLRTMTNKVRASYTVATRGNAISTAQLTPKVLVHLGSGELVGINHAQPAEFPATVLPTVDPKAVAFYTFTSGSSGIPKAIATQHFAWCSGHIAHAHKYGKHDGVIAFQNASYSFLPSIVEMLSTLLVGGRIAIPNPHEQRNDLGAEIRRLSPQHIGLTPSAARTLDPSQIPSLETLIFVGEPAPEVLIRKWLDVGQMTLLNGYGQSEGCGMTSTAKLGREGVPYHSVGRCTWLRCWVVDPSDVNRLMPVGAVGELILEGHSLAQGYFDEPELTAAAFIRRPKWADAFGIGHDLRFYKTKDLVQWQANAEMRLVGRCDAQTKFHGMRIHVGEIEHHVAQVFPEEVSEVAVEKITIASGEDQTERLIAFIVAKNIQGRPVANSDSQIESQSAPSSKTPGAIEDFFKKELHARLGQKIPLWMIPTEVTVLDAMPRTATGKLHRSVLRQLRASKAQEKPSTFPEEKRPVEEDPENKTPACNLMRSIWADILHIENRNISTKDSWVQLGGDSLTVMALVRKSRAAGFALNTTDIMTGMTLLEASQTVANSTNGISNPTTLEQQDLNREHDRQYPLTDFQKYYLTEDGQTDGTYDYTISLRGTFTLERLRLALKNLIRQVQILRITFVTTPQGDVTQTILPMNSDLWKSRVRSSSSSLPQDVLIDPVVFKIPESDEQSSGNLTFSLHIHHAIFDGLSLRMLLEDFVDVYLHDSVRNTRPDFTTYLESRLLPRSEESYHHWRNLLRGSTPSRPILNPPKSSENNQYSQLPTEHRFMRMLHLSPSPPTQRIFPASILFQAAWSIILSCLTRDLDVTFLYLYHGRDETFPSADHIIGCCVTEIPFRIILDPTSPREEFLLATQHQIHSSIPHSHLGASTIAQHCTDWPTSSSSDHPHPTSNSEENNNNNDDKSTWYHHRTYLLHQNLDTSSRTPSSSSLPIGDRGYMHIARQSKTKSPQDRNYGDYSFHHERCRPNDFDIETSSSAGNKGEMGFDLRCRSDLYSWEEGGRVAEGFVEVLRALAEGGGTVGKIRDAVLSGGGFPRMWAKGDGV
jgi:amino acid adenylation domain-containing protein